MIRAVAPGKLLSGKAYRLLSIRTSQNDKLTLDSLDLLWWSQPQALRGGIVDFNTPHTDANDSGWGGYMNEQQAAGYWSRSRALGLWRPSPLTGPFMGGSDPNFPRIIEANIHFLRIFKILTFPTFSKSSTFLAFSKSSHSSHFHPHKS